MPRETRHLRVNVAFLRRSCVVFLIFQSTPCFPCDVQRSFGSMGEDGFAQLRGHTPEGRRGQWKACVYTELLIYMASVRLLRYHWVVIFLSSSNLSSYRITHSVPLSLLGLQIPQMYRKKGLPVLTNIELWTVEEGIWCSFSWHVGTGTIWNLQEILHKCDINGWRYCTESFAGRGFSIQ